MVGHEGTQLCTSGVHAAVLVHDKDRSKRSQRLEQWHKWLLVAVHTQRLRKHIHDPPVAGVETWADARVRGAAFDPVTQAYCAMFFAHPVTTISAAGDRAGGEDQRPLRPRAQIREQFGPGARAGAVSKPRRVQRPCVIVGMSPRAHAARAAAAAPHTTIRVSSSSHIFFMRSQRLRKAKYWLISCRTELTATFFFQVKTLDKHETSQRLGRGAKR